MILAHVAGIPFEELLTPSATGLAAGLLATLAPVISFLRRHRSATRPR
jgi:hypothetical protein